MPESNDEGEKITGHAPLVYSDCYLITKNGNIEQGIMLDIDGWLAERLQELKPNHR